MSTEYKYFLVLLDTILKQYLNIYIAIAIALKLQNFSFEAWILNKSILDFEQIYKHHCYCTLFVQ